MGIMRMTGIYSESGENCMRKQREGKLVLGARVVTMRMMPDR